MDILRIATGDEVAGSGAPHSMKWGSLCYPINWTMFSLISTKGLRLKCRYAVLISIISLSPGTTHGVRPDITGFNSPLCTIQYGGVVMWGDLLIG